MRRLARRAPARSPRDRRSRRPGRRRASVLVSSPPPSSATTVRPSAPGDALPASTHGAGEVGDERRRGRGGQLGGRALLLDPSLAQHRDAVAERRRLAEVVRHEQRRNAGLGASARAARRLAAGARGRVKRRERLVEQQRARLARQRASQGHPLALAARERAGVGVGERAGVEALEQLLGAGSALAAREARAARRPRSPTRAGGGRARSPGRGTRSAAPRARRSRRARCRATPPRRS